MASLRVVLDTNVLVSGLAYPGSVPGCIVGAWRQGRIQAVLCHHVLHELERVLPKLPRAGLDAHDIRDLIDSLLLDRKSTRLNSSHHSISYAVFCLKKKK